VQHDEIVYVTETHRTLQHFSGRRIIQRTWLLALVIHRSPFSHLFIDNEIHFEWFYYRNFDV